MRTQLNAATHRLMRTIPARGYEQPPSPFAGEKACYGRLATKIERNEESLAFVFARKNEKIAVGTDAPIIAAERQRRTFAPQIH